jgi:hypothetical protein
MTKWIPFAIVAAPVIYVVAVFNRLVRMRNLVREGWSGSSLGLPAWREHRGGSRRPIQGEMAGLQVEKNFPIRIGRLHLHDQRGFPA